MATITSTAPAKPAETKLTPQAIAELAWEVSDGDASKAGQEVLGIITSGGYAVADMSAAYSFLTLIAKAAGREEGAAASTNGSGTKTVKEVVSTKPGWLTMRYTGRGFPTTASVAAWEALLAYLKVNGEKMEDMVAQVRKVGNDEKAHRKLSFYSAAKEKRDEPKK